MSRGVEDVVCLEKARSPHEKTHRFASVCLDSPRYVTFRFLLLSRSLSYSFTDLHAHSLTS
jgi:hypothetical protein